MLGLLFLIVVVLVVAGVILWALPKLPLDATLAQVIRVLIIAGVIIWIVWTLYTHLR